MNKTIRKLAKFLLIVVLIMASAEAVYRFVFKPLIQNESDTPGIVTSKEHDNGGSTTAPGQQSYPGSNVSQTTSNEFPDTGPKLDANLANGIISGYFDLITQGKHDEAYDLLDPLYKARYCPTAKDFTDYISGRFPGTNIKDINIAYFTRIDSSRYICKAEITDNPEYAENPDTTIRKEEFTIYYEDRDRYRLALSGFVEARSPDRSAVTGNIEIKVKDIAQYHFHTEVLAEVSNRDSQEIVIKSGDSSQAFIQAECVYQGRKEKVEVNRDRVAESLNDFPVSAGAAAEIKYTFPVPAGSSLEKVYFDRIQVGHEFRKAEIFLQ